MNRVKLFLFIALFSLSQLMAVSNPNLSDRLRNHVSVLASDSLKGRGLGTEGAEKARAYIIRQFKSVGIKPLDGSTTGYLQPFTFRQSLAWIQGSNVVGIIEGTDPTLKNEYILIGAHYDHLGYELIDGQEEIYPGADDNASGVASIIEIGRYFSKHPENLKRSLLVVAFDGEESGLLGSDHFVNFSPVPIQDIKLMFSLDMVGMLSENKGLILKGMGIMEDGAELAKEIVEKYSFSLKNTGDRYEKRTDTAPFAKKGIPSVHVFTGTNSPYHKPEDQYQLLDYDGMAEINLYMVDLIGQLSALEDISARSSFTSSVLAQSSVKENALSTGFSVYMGSGFHRYEDAFFRANPLFSVAGGFFLQLPVGKFLTLQQEVLYDLNRSKMEGGDFNRHSITLPFNIQYGTPRISDGNIRLFSFAGPYFRYSFGGKAASENLSFDIYQQQEWGYTVGVGVDLFMISLAYSNRIALTDLLISDQHTIYNTNNYFSLSYRF